MATQLNLKRSAQQRTAYSCQKSAGIASLRPSWFLPKRVEAQANTTLKQRAWVSRGPTHPLVTAAASAATAAPSTADVENPFLGAGQLKLLTTSGSQVSVEEVTNGKVVVALLRHLGCLFCWEQAQNLLRVRDQLTAAGYKLVVVAIGTPEGGQQFTASLPFPSELLLLDPDRHLYSHLECFEGFKALFSPQTWEALKARPWDEMKPLMEKYKLIKPKNIESTAVMGGLWVLQDGKVLYGHRDPGLAVHAPMDEVLAACRGGQGVAA